MSIKQVFKINNEEYTLRNFTLDDVKPLFDIMSQTQNVIAYGRYVPYGNIKKMVEWNVKSPNDDTVWAIGNPGKIIGFVGFGEIKDPNKNLFVSLLPKGIFCPKKKNFYVMIYLDKNYIGKGIGKMALTEAIGILSEQVKGEKNIFYSTYSDNSNSVSLAKSLGMDFVVSGKIAGKDVSVFLKIQNP